MIASHAVDNGVDGAPIQRGCEVKVGASVVEEDYVGAALFYKLPVRSAGGGGGEEGDLRQAHWNKKREA